MGLGPRDWRRATSARRARPGIPANGTPPSPDNMPLPSRREAQPSERLPRAGARRAPIAALALLAAVFPGPLSAEIAGSAPSAAGAAAPRTAPGEAAASAALPELDLARALAALEAPEAGERAAAERWLTAHLERRDFPELAQAVENGGLELEWRLASALAVDPRHLGLAALCANDPSPRLRALGERAVQGLARSWLAEAGTAPIPFEMFVARLGLEPTFRVATQLAGRPLAILVGRLDRALGRELELTGRTPIGISIAPDLAAQVLALRAGPRIEGPWAQVFAAVVREHFASLGLAIDAYGGGEAASWIVVRGPGAARPADELLFEWVLAFERSPDGDERLRAARALAGSGWPAALAWLVDRWVAEGDLTARHGAFYAAARGAAAPELATVENVRWLVLELDRRLASGEAADLASAAAIVRTAAGIGPLAADGGDLVQELAAGWDELGGRARYGRLALFDEVGRTPGAIAAAIRAWFEPAAERAPPALLWQALRALGRAEPGADGVEVEPALALLEAAVELEPDLATVLGVLERARARPAPAWRAAEPEGQRAGEPPEGAPAAEPIPAVWPLDRASGARLALALWWIALDEPDAAGDSLARLAPLFARPEERAGERAAAGGRGPGEPADLDPGAIDAELFCARALELALPMTSPGTVEAALARAFGEGTEPALRFAALSAGIGEAAALDLLASAAIREPRTPADCAVLGALAALPETGEVARERLVALATAALAAQAGAAREEGARAEPRAEPWIAGVERAFGDLARRGDDVGAGWLRLRLQGPLRKARHPLHQAFAAGLWPYPPGRPAAALEGLDREFTVATFAGF